MLELKKKVGSNNLKTSMTSVFLCKRIRSYFCPESRHQQCMVSLWASSSGITDARKPCWVQWMACVCIVVIPRIIPWATHPQSRYSNKSHFWRTSSLHLWRAIHTVFNATTSTAHPVLSLFSTHLGVTKAPSHPWVNVISSTRLVFLDFCLWGLVKASFDYLISS